MMNTPAAHHCRQHVTAGSTSLQAARHCRQHVTAGSTSLRVFLSVWGLQCGPRLMPDFALKHFRDHTRSTAVDNISVVSRNWRKSLTAGRCALQYCYMFSPFRRSNPGHHRTCTCIIHALVNQSANHILVLYRHTQSTIT